MSDTGATRVAIVGAGPRGIHAAERLLAHAQGLGRRVAVVVFDPRPPGVGAAYATDQPEHVRLNVRSAVVDAGRRTGPAPSAEWVEAFDAWRVAAGEAEPLEPFPPRALVGRYLAEVWRTLLEHVPTGCSLTHEAVEVGAVERGASDADAAWLVDGRPFDEVLLATGHASDWPGALRHDWRSTQALVPAVFPVAALDEHAVPAGARVAVRGAALTFIDAALTLTEGRDGRFVGDEGGVRYEPSGREPAVLWPITREGRWMEAKPEPGSATEQLDLTALTDQGRAAVRDAADDRDALDQVRRTAHAYLNAAGGDDHAELDAVFTGRPTTDPTDALRASLAVARGAAIPHGAWAVGRAWRDLYPALVERFGGLDGDFGPFAEAGARLERVAFGPPPVNAAKIVALIDAGIIDPASLATATVDAEGVRFAGGTPDVVIDGVLPPPGLEPGPATLPGVLAERGLLARASGRRGLAIDPDGTCLAPDGDRREGLAAVGRPTEDVVIGNDTLDRSLHDTIERWAARVAGSASGREETR